MASDRERLNLLLDRLRLLELQRTQPHEAPIVEIGRTALFEEISRLAHRLHDLQYAAARSRGGSPAEVSRRGAITASTNREHLACLSRASVGASSWLAIAWRMEPPPTSRGDHRALGRPRQDGCRRPSTDTILGEPRLLATISPATQPRSRSAFPRA